MAAFAFSAEPRKLHQQLRGDVDLIVMKAMDKDPLLRAIGTATGARGAGRCGVQASPKFRGWIEIEVRYHEGTDEKPA